MKYFTDKTHKIRKQYTVPIEFEDVDGQKIDDPKLFVAELLKITKKDLRIGINVANWWSASFDIKVWKDGSTLYIEHLNQDLFNELIENIQMDLALKNIYEMIENLLYETKVKLKLK